jgi:hypothetical protein
MPQYRLRRLALPSNEETLIGLYADFETAACVAKAEMERLGDDPRWKASIEFHSYTNGKFTFILDFYINGQWTLPIDAPRDASAPSA